MQKNDLQCLPKATTVFGLLENAKGIDVAQPFQDKVKFIDCFFRMDMKAIVRLCLKEDGSNNHSSLG